MNSNIRAIVVGRNYTSRLGMIRALGACGLDVHVIRTMPKRAVRRFGNKDVDAYSRYVKGYRIAIEPDRQNLVEVIRSLRTPGATAKDLLVPVDDFSASTIDENADLLSADFAFPNIRMEQGAITRLMDKGLQKQLAEEAGLEVAHGWTLEVKAGQYELPADLRYPCFPKPLVSFKGNKQCMKRCDTPEQLHSAISMVTRLQPDCPFEIEEYIEIEKEYATLGFSDGKRVVMPAMIRLLRDGSGSHKGVTMLGQVLPGEAFADFLSKLEQLILQTGLVGLFDIDSYECGGQLYFNELNLRFGASGYAITASGCNLPQLFVQHVLTGKADLEQTISQEHLFVNEKVALDDYFGGYLSGAEYSQMAADADIRFILQAEDSRPYAVFRLKVLQQKAKMQVKKLLKLLR